MSPPEGGPRGVARNWHAHPVFRTGPGGESTSFESFTTSTMIQCKRVYDDVSSQDGTRVLVDRLWPRGVSKEEAELDRWLKEVAPSDELRQWFDHDPDRWDGFCERYYEELSEKKKAVAFLRDAAREGALTLVYAARDREHNNAAALKTYLEAGTDTGS